MVVHCVTERQARNLVAAIGDRMEQVGLRLHPEVVYCKDQKRRLDYELTAFTFLGFTFRSRTARGKSGALFASFQPAVSNDRGVFVIPAIATGQRARTETHADLRQ